MDRFGALAGLPALHCAACTLLLSLFAALGVAFPQLDGGG